MRGWTATRGAGYDRARDTAPGRRCSADPHPGYDRVAARETVVMYNALAYVLAGPLDFGPVGLGAGPLLGTSSCCRSASWAGWRFRSTSSGSGTVRTDYRAGRPRSRHDDGCDRR